MRPVVARKLLLPGRGGIIQPSDALTAETSVRIAESIPASPAPTVAENKGNENPSAAKPAALPKE